jgi:hypothetical protein
VARTIVNKLQMVITNAVLNPQGSVCGIAAIIKLFNKNLGSRSKTLDGNYSLSAAIAVRFMLRINQNRSYSLISEPDAD